MQEDPTFYLLIFIVIILIIISIRYIYNGELNNIETTIIVIIGIILLIFVISLSCIIYNYIHSSNK
jgi:hypothetical protein